MSCARCAVTSSGSSPGEHRASASRRRSRVGALVLAGPRASRAYSLRLDQLLRAACAIAFARVPGDLPRRSEARRRRACTPTIARARARPRRPSSPRVFTIMRLAGDQRPRRVAGVDRGHAEAAHPLDQRARARCRRRSRAARAGSAPTARAGPGRAGWFRAPARPTTVCASIRPGVDHRGVERAVAGREPATSAPGRRPRSCRRADQHDAVADGRAGHRVHRRRRARRPAPRAASARARERQQRRAHRTRASLAASSRRQQHGRGSRRAPAP